MLVFDFNSVGDSCFAFAGEQPSVTNLRESRGYFVNCSFTYFAFPIKHFGNLAGIKMCSFGEFNLR